MSALKVNIIGSHKRNQPFGTEIAFLKGLRQLSDKEIEVNPVDPFTGEQKYWYDADITLVFKCLPSWEEVDKCAGKKIVYQPDDIRYPHIYQLMEEARKHCDYAFTYDLEATEICRDKLNFKKAEILLLTADPELYRQLPEFNFKKDIDFSFVGNFSHPINHASRRRMIEVLEKAGYKVVYLNAFYDIEKIVELYNRSLVVLNHATDVGQEFGFGYGLQCRHFEAGMTGACLLTNRILNDLGYLQEFCTFGNEEELLKWAEFALKEPEKMLNIGEMFKKEIYQSHLPIHRAQQMLKMFKEIA